MIWRRATRASPPEVVPPSTAIDRRMVRGIYAGDCVPASSGIAPERVAEVGGRPQREPPPSRPRELPPPRAADRVDSLRLLRRRVVVAVEQGRLGRPLALVARQPLVADRHLAEVAAAIALRAGVVQRPP